MVQESKSIASGFGHGIWLARAMRKKFPQTEWILKSKAREPDAIVSVQARIRLREIHPSTKRERDL